MGKRLVGGDALIWVKLKQTSYQVETLLGRIRHQVFQALLRTRRGTLDHTRSVMRLYAVDVDLTRLWYVLQNAFELIERRGSRKNGRAEEHLAQDASHTPHVHSLGVLGRGEEDLGRAIPTRGNVLGERWIGAVLALVCLVHQRSRQAEVAQLDVTLLVEQDVRGFLIAMNYISRVQVLSRFEQLMHYVLLVYVFENGFSFDYIVQVGFYISKK